MKLETLQPTKLAESVKRVFTASDRLAIQVQSSIEDFSDNHLERFQEAGTVGGTLLIVSALAKDAVNTLKISEDLEDGESVNIHNAVKEILTGTSMNDAIGSLSAKEQLLVQAFLLAYQMGNLPEAVHALPASFNASVNPDNSVTTSDKVEEVVENE